MTTQNKNQLLFKGLLVAQTLFLAIYTLKKTI
jgi:hypothetical protein